MITLLAMYIYCNPCDVRKTILHSPFSLNFTTEDRHTVRVIFVMMTAVNETPSVTQHLQPHSLQDDGNNSWILFLNWIFPLMLTE